MFVLRIETTEEKRFIDCATMLDCSTKWVEYRDSNNLVASQMKRGVILLFNGLKTAEVSYDGGLWDLKGGAIG